LVFRVEHDALVTKVVSADHETTINIVGLSTAFISCVTVCLIGATSDNSIRILFHARGSKCDECFSVLVSASHHRTYCYAHGVVSASRN
jgi:hypothetical protein